MFGCNHCRASVVVADDLAPNWRQVISNSRDDVSRLVHIMSVSTSFHPPAKIERKLRSLIHTHNKFFPAWPRSLECRACWPPYIITECHDDRSPWNNCPHCRSWPLFYVNNQHRKRRLFCEIRYITTHTVSLYTGAGGVCSGLVCAFCKRPCGSWTSFDQKSQNRITRYRQSIRSWHGNAFRITGPLWGVTDSPTQGQ